MRNDIEDKMGSTIVARINSVRMSDADRQRALASLRDADLVVDALIAANKDFDLIMFPNRGHGFGNEPYMVRRRWDYFVKHLMGAEPPPAYEIKGAQ